MEKEVAEMRMKVQYILSVPVGFHNTVPVGFHNTKSKDIYKINAAEILDNLQKAVLFDIAQRQARQGCSSVSLLRLAQFSRTSSMFSICCFN
ncbi:hypothetical protein Dthio_PD0723 [Desulfonatronospira thiodismutans ASO3-1]|uniref:Uncharacterized protein n=1 Tax=Desulfonatronospira thiodismutans ASO3-1 TaxID=555779 RepID=D6SRS6_9BACT|nr:hypothetical protein Dthio_PD0723 [Desulfonatronospira thiodismutans ASO3-1]